MEKSQNEEVFGAQEKRDSKHREHLRMAELKKPGEQVFYFGAEVQGILEEIFFGRSIDWLLLLEAWIVINNVKIHYSPINKGKREKNAKEKVKKI